MVKPQDLFSINTLSLHTVRDCGLSLLLVGTEVFYWWPASEFAPSLKMCFLLDGQLSHMLIFQSLLAKLFNSIFYILLPLETKC